MIQLTISDADLKNATVHGALANLIAAITPRGPGRPPRAASPPAVATAPARRGRPPKTAPTARNEKKARKQKPSKPAGHPARHTEKPTPEQWAKFVEGLGDRQKKFLALLEEKKTLTHAAAAKALGLKDAKALGGIVGSVLRWGPARGIRLPFVATRTEAGEKAWVWEG